MASATPPPPPPLPASSRPAPSEDEIQRILSSKPKGLEPSSPFRGFSITALISYIAGAAMLVTGLSSQSKASDQRSAQAINVAAGFTLICLASICRHTKRLSSNKDS